jgi:hypothetical protein
MHDGPHDHPHPHPHPHPHGHNAARDAAQWQTPHLPPGEIAGAAPPERDLDLVETSFIEGFTRCTDPTSFLRLAAIPFSATTPDGRTLNLLRVEIEDLTDVGSAVPLLGGQGMRYDPLPSRLVSRRRRLSFAYHDGAQTMRLDFGAVRALATQKETP